MGEKDITEKMLEDYNDVFADIINGLVYKGKQVIKPEDLVNTHTHTMYKAGQKIHEQERDLSKILKKKHTRIALLGLENQTRVDPHMAQRIISYDGASYRAQVDLPIKDAYRVITFVLYTGMERWKGGKHLSDLFSKEAADELDAYFQDYGFNVFEIAYLSEEEIRRFHSDFKYFAKYVVCRRLGIDYEPEPGIIRHVDALLKLLAAYTGDRRFEEVLNAIPKEKKEGGITMSEVLLDRMEERGMERGIQKGILQGRKEGIEEGMHKGERKAMIRTAGKMLASGKYDDAEILSLTGISADELAKIRNTAGK